MNIFSVRHSKASEKSTLTYRTKKEPKRESSDSSPTFRNKDKEKLGITTSPEYTI